MRVHHVLSAIAGFALLTFITPAFAEQVEEGEVNTRPSTAQTSPAQKPADETDLEKLAGSPTPAPTTEPTPGTPTPPKEDSTATQTPPPEATPPKTEPKLVAPKQLIERQPAASAETALPRPAIDGPMTPKPVPNPAATTERETTPTERPSAHPPATRREAPSAAATTARSGVCKPTLIKREDTDKHPNFGVTFPKGDLEGLKRCNPGAEVKDTRLGPMLTVTYQRGRGAPIQLPDTMATGDANNAKCVPDEHANVVDVVLRKQQWSDGIPAVIELMKVDRPFYDAEKLLAKCKQFAAKGLPR